jgi:hypothetical protein
MECALMLRNPTYRQLPDLLTDLPLFPQGDPLSVILPLARRNLLTNPSFETNLTGWSSWNGGATTRVSTRQVAGAYSMQVAIGVPPAGTYTNFTPLNATTYAFSVSVYAAPGVAFSVQFMTPAGTVLAQRSGVGTGRWQRLSVLYTTTSTTTLYAAVLVQTANKTIWIDAAQLEVCEPGNWFATTYIDGDQRGLIPNQAPAPYGWDGTPHASTSYRLATTRAGGYPVPFSQFGLMVVALLGLGLAPVQVQGIQYSQIDGGQYMRTHKGGRDFTIAARLNAPTFEQIQRLRSALGAALDRDANALDQPLVLRYQPVNACGDATGAAARIPCAYTGGLEGGASAPNGVDLNLNFTAYMPLVQAEREAGTVLTAAQNTASASYLLGRDTTGLWKTMSSGVSGGVVRTIVPGPDGLIYIGGDFTSAGGVANTARIARYNPTSNTFSALGSGISSGSVRSMAFDAGGANLYVGGTFTSAGGVANTRFIARWNGSSWQAMGSGTTGGTGVTAVTLAGTTVVIGGSFTTPGTNLAFWSTSSNTWTAGSANGAVQALLYDARGTLYMAGRFTTIMSVSAVNMARLSSGVTTAMSLGSADNTVLTLALAADGTLYAGGSFTTGDGGFNVAAWNGTTWRSLGTGTNNQVNDLTIAPDGVLWVAGAFTQVNGVNYPTGLAWWLGTQWAVPDVQPTATVFDSVAFWPDGTVYTSFESNGTTALAAGLTTVTNSGTGAAAPRIVLRNTTANTTSQVYGIRNVTSGGALYFAPLTISGNETVTIDLDPERLSVTSDTRGVLPDAILPGSTPLQMALRPGANTISMFGAGFLAPSAWSTAVMVWTPDYLSVDGVIDQ